MIILLTLILLALKKNELLLGGIRLFCLFLVHLTDHLKQILLVAIKGRWLATVHHTMELRQGYDCFRWAKNIPRPENALLPLLQFSILNSGPPVHKSKHDWLDPIVAEVKLCRGNASFEHLAAPLVVSVKRLLITLIVRSLIRNAAFLLNLRKVLVWKVLLKYDITLLHERAIRVQRVHWTAWICLETLQRLIIFVTAEANTDRLNNRSFGVL